MKLLVALTALVLPISALSASVAGGEKLTIAGISPGDTLGNITAMHGRPISQERSDGFIVLQVRYDRLSFDLDEDGIVANAETANPKYCFNDWLCPGAPMSTVRSKLPGLTQPSSLGAPFVAYADGDGCWLEITALAQNVTSLAFKCQP